VYFKTNNHFGVRVENRLMKHMRQREHQGKKKGDAVGMDRGQEKEAKDTGRPNGVNFEGSVQKLQTMKLTSCRQRKTVEARPIRRIN